VTWIVTPVQYGTGGDDMPVTAARMVAEARARVRELTPGQVETFVYGREALVVDLREATELDDEGLIAGAHHVPRGLLEFWADPDSDLHRSEFDPDRTTILYCASGRRSALAAVVLGQLGYRDVAHLQGGLDAWKQAGLPVVGLTSTILKERTAP
jgi:rhodanese-related sulfurtransferase